LRPQDLKELIKVYEPMVKARNEMRTQQLKRAP